LKKAESNAPDMDIVTRVVASIPTTKQLKMIAAAGL
jgi:hypothetical protein